jgi:hypothetical protein
MKIDCYISQTCSSEGDLRKNITEALKLEDIKTPVQFHRISDKEAKEMGVMGSPSIFIDSVDIVPGETPGFS